MTVAELIAKLAEQNPDNVIRFEGGWDGEGYLTIYDSNEKVVESWEDSPPIDPQPIEWDKLSDSTKQLMELILNSRKSGTYAEELKKFIGETP